MGAVRRIAVEDAPALAALRAVERVETVDLVQGGRVVARIDGPMREDITGAEAVAWAKRLRRNRILGDVDLKTLIGDGRE